MAETEYRRLTGGRLRRMGFVTAFATRSSLWLGMDHLLCIDSSGYAEEYKRFYFRDIQAVALRKTRRRYWWNVVLVPLTFGFFILFGATAPETPPSSWSSNEILGGAFLGSISLLFLLLLLLNTFRGPACVCHLRTAVQEAELPSLNRVRRARKVLDRLRPLIEAAQGTLTPEEIAHILADAPPQESPPVIARHLPAPTVEPIRHYHGTAHLILFWLLLVDLPLTGINLFFPSGWLDAASILLLIVTIAFIIASLIKQRHSDLPVGLKRIPWISMVCTAVFLVTAIAYAILMIANDSAAMLEEPLEDPVVVVMTAISTTLNVALGAFGFILLKRFRAAYASSGSAPPPVIHQFNA